MTPFSVTNEEALKYELETREQLSAADWYRLRKHRLTALHFKKICSRKQNFDSLSQRLLLLHMEYYTKRKLPGIFASVR